MGDYRPSEDEDDHDDDVDHKQDDHDDHKPDAEKETKFILKVEIRGSSSSLPGVDQEAPPGRPPDGGWGWVVVLSATFMFAIIGLSITAFGIFYIQMVDNFNSQKGTIGWIGSLHMFCDSVCGVFVSLLIHSYGCRMTAAVGGLLLSTGFLLSAFVQHAWILYITYGVLAGVGAGSVYLSAAVIVQQYFDRHRAKAAAWSLTGYSVGAVSAGPIVQLLIDFFTWRGALIIIAGFSLHIIIFSGAFRPVSQYMVVKPKMVPVDASDEGSRGYGRKISDKFAGFLSVLAVKKLLMLCAGGFLLSISVKAFFFHTPSRAHFYGVDRSKVALLPTFMSIGDLPVRFLTGCLANSACVNRILLYAVVYTMIAVMIMISTTATSYWSIAMFCVIVGLLYGVPMTVRGTALVDLLGVEKYSFSQSVYTFCCGFGSLISTPLVGYVFDVTGDYSVGLLAVGALGTLGGLISLAVPVLDLVQRRSRRSEELRNVVHEKVLQ